MTAMFSGRHIAGLFILSVASLTYIWQDTVGHLVHLILNVEAFSHGQLVPFISLWLIWSLRTKLKTEELIVWPPGFVLLTLAVFVWYVGEITELRLLGHIAYVSAIQALILTFFGPNIFQRILFPCLFLYLAIPIGHGLIPIMQDVTAKLSVGLLALVGIEYELDGILITISSGVYEVARACAGVRFLFTSVVTGFLLSYLVYSKWHKRILLILASAVIPVFANVLRVFGIFLISEATDQSFAREVDHIIYGWVFLSVVLLLIIIVAYKFADAPEELNKGEVWLPFSAGGNKVILGGVLIGAFIVPVGAASMVPSIPTKASEVKTIAVPECMDCNIRKLSRVSPYEKALFSGADAELHANYRIAADQIMVSTALYCPQRPESRLIQIGNMSRGKGWLNYQQKSTATVEIADVPFVEFVLVKNARTKHVWSSYYIDGKWLASPRKIKWAAALERMKKGQSAGAILVISSTSDVEQQKSRALAKKLLSTFSPESFLWDEIKPTLKGSAVCVE